MIVYATALLALHVPRAPLSHVRANAFPFNEFSRPIPVESLGKKAVRHEVTATTEECAVRWIQAWLHQRAQERAARVRPHIGATPSVAQGRTLQAKSVAPGAIR